MKSKGTSINWWNIMTNIKLTFPWDMFVLTFSTTFFCVKYFLLQRKIESFLNEYSEILEIQKDHMAA